jgi:hypothetical protein
MVWFSSATSLSQVMLYKKRQSTVKVSALEELQAVLSYRQPLELVSKRFDVITL